MPDLSAIATKAPKDVEKKASKEKTSELVLELDELQNRLYASSSHSVLIVLQGMDASGKDGAIRKVLGQMNPQGVRVQSFKAPTDEEKAHDFLWRIHQHTPAKGMIQVFNRSHYEDVLITRVHGWCNDQTALERFEAINHFEKMLALHNNTLILKFFLHISKEEQAERLKERKHDPKKQWKYNRKDYTESSFWDQYMSVYSDAIEHCSAIPWQVIPADNNWYKEYLIAQTLVEAMRGLNLSYPALKEQKKQVTE